MIAAFGAFDGLHIGHTALLGAARGRAEREGREWGVLTFKRGGVSRVKGGAALFTFEEQMLLERYRRVPKVCRVEFDDRLAAMGPREFLDMAREEFGVDGYVVGAGFHFGHGRAGTERTIADYCAECGGTADIVPIVEVGGVPVCSSTIRAALADGDMEAAAGMLGHPYFVAGRVTRGLGRGAGLGFPTANIETPPDKVRVPDGVYAAAALVDGVWRAAAVNAGSNPTFGDVAAPRFELNLLDFSGDLYGKEILFMLLTRVRGEIRFSGADELASRIAKDIEIVRAFYAGFASREVGLMADFARAAGAA